MISKITQGVQHPIISYKNLIFFAILYIRTQTCKILCSSLIISLSKDRNLKTSKMLILNVYFQRLKLRKG